MRPFTNGVRMSDYRDLGMDRRIERRDFLGGVAVGIAGALVRSSDARAAAQPPASSATYPPARTGLRGNHPSAVDAFGRIDAGAYRRLPALDADTAEDYDL